MEAKKEAQTRKNFRHIKIKLKKNYFFLFLKDEKHHFREHHKATSRRDHPYTEIQST